MGYNNGDDKTPSFEIWSSKYDGSYTTPGFGKKFACNQVFPNVHFVLQLPLVALKKTYGVQLTIEIGGLGTRHFLLGRC